MMLRVALAVLILGIATGSTVSDQKWATFKKDFGRKYATAAEDTARRATFAANLQRIVALNAAPGAAAYGVGEFADLTPAEFMAQYTSSPPPPPLEAFSRSADRTYLGQHRAEPGATFPASLDWVEKKAVTAVKKQGCGNCWTFSAAGSLEGASAIKYGHLTNYSEQEFVDCIDSGCNGGWNFNAIKFAVNHTVCTMEAFPCDPEAKDNGTQCALWEASPCSGKKGALTKGSLSGWKSVGGAKWGATSEADLQSALQLGPVSINMFADSHLGHYSGGVLQYSNCSEGTNHGVLAVGYGTCEPGKATGPCANATKAIDYWKVKNSWGTTFGVDGYFYLARGVYAAGCGPASILLQNPSYPVMA